MGLFDSLFGRRDREIAELMNPVLGMKLIEFVISNDDPNYVKHYFKFRNKNGEDEEFVTIYHRAGSQLEYLRTMSRRNVWGPEFQTLSESGPWSMTITSLLERGQQLSANTNPTRGHFSAKIGASTPLEPVRVTASPSQPVTGAARQRPRVSADASEWQVQRKEGIEGSSQSEEISQTYHYSGLNGPSAKAVLRLVCTVACTPDAQKQQVIVHRRLRFYLRPFSLPHEAPFTLRLYTTDQSLGGTFSVVAAPDYGENETAVIARYAGKDDVTKCLEALMSGKHMTFTLADKTETLVELPLPSDQVFKEIYEDACKRLAELETASGTVAQRPAPLSAYSEMVRKNPKGYAIWLYETDAKELQVLLVKLNDDGSNMDDAWSLGTFSSSSEQSTFGLEAARYFHIKLMDVVPTSTQDANISAPNELTYSVEKMDNQKFPPSHGTIWLDGDEIWLGQATKDFSFDGRPYHIPGSMVCFAKAKAARMALLNVLRKERDLWAPGDEATVKARLIAHAEKLRDRARSE